MSKQEVLVNKIDELFDTSILFLEKQRKLSPAGKFQACILTTALIIKIIEYIDGIGEVYGNKMEKILSLLEPKLINRFEIYSQEYENTNYEVENLNNEFLTGLLQTSNKLLIIKDKQFVKNAIIIGFSHFFREIEEYQLGFERYNSGIGKIIIPENIFISLYVDPFFNYLVENKDKIEICEKIETEVSYSELEDFDFDTIPAKLMNFLASKLNEDEEFVQKMKSDFKEYNPNISKSNNKGCMLMISVFLFCLFLVYFNK